MRGGKDSRLHNHLFGESLQWRHIDCGGVSNHRRLDCLLIRLFRPKKTPKLRVTGLCEGDTPVTVGFPSQKASIAENVSIWWCHRVYTVVFLFLWTVMISDTLIFIWAWYGIFHSLQGKQFALLSSITTENNIKLKCFNIRLRTHLRFGVLSNGFIDGNGTAVIIAQQHSAMHQNQLLPATTRTRFNSGTRWHVHRGMYKTL